MEIKKLSPKKFKAKGFTLAEVLIVASVVSLIMTTLLSLYVAGQRYFINESARADVLRDIRQGLNWLSRDIKEGIQVVSSWDAYTTSANCLVLQVPSVDSNGLIIDVDNEFDYIIYRLNSQFPNRLERIVDAKDGVSSRVDSSRAIITRVDSFLLRSQGVDLSSVSDLSHVSRVDLTLITTQNRLGRTYQETLKTGVKLRNKSD